MNENIQLLNSSEFSYKDLISSLIMAAMIVVCVNMFFIIAIVRGPSMEPTLNEGDILIASRFAQVEKGDVVLANPDDSIVVKRVSNTVNGYYLLGDNRDQSYDSRDYGPVDEVIGKVVCRVTPRPRFF